MPQTITVVKNILEANDALARRNRKDFAREKVVVLNLMGTPGAGKTALLECSLGRLAGEFRVAVIEGDIQTTFDADRLARIDLPVIQINTGAECHLDAGMLAAALDEVQLANIDLLVIENVGNLVCPAEFDLGETARCMVVSVPEGAEKPEKYPLMFSTAAVVVLNKTDLLPHCDFDLAGFERGVRQVNADAPIVQLSATGGEGVDQWIEWVRSLLVECGDPASTAKGTALP